MRSAPPRSRRRRGPWKGPQIWTRRHAWKARASSDEVGAHLGEAPPATVVELVRVGDHIQASPEQAAIVVGEDQVDDEYPAPGCDHRASAINLDGGLRGRAPVHQQVKVVGMVQPRRTRWRGKGAARHGVSESRRAAGAFTLHEGLRPCYEQPLPLRARIGPFAHASEAIDSPSRRQAREPPFSYEIGLKWEGFIGKTMAAALLAQPALLPAMAADRLRLSGNQARFRDLRREAVQEI